jgi:hypothetical protein
MCCCKLTPRRHFVAYYVKALADMVSETNSLIKSLCNQNKWDFLTNSNIEAAHLNSTGLHLNLSGSQLLQSSFKLAIAR